MITEDTISSDEVVIEAPVQCVWDVLVDFANYDKWNTFCPGCEAELEIGSPVVMQVDLGFGIQEQTEYMSRIDPGEVIAWQMENKPGDPIHAVRTQYLKALGDARCSYISIDEFSGEATAGMMELMAKPVETGFNLCAYGLKEYCEARYSESV
ncbi:MAG: hypothetical protein ACJAUG_001748 [Halioglobus sp.]|jgi:uncharacterized protein YndB with AHSA1/START domain